MKIEAAVLRELHAPLSVETLTLDSPRSGEVLVEMKASGVCHSDWHCVTGDSTVALPLVLGHEGSGVVAEVGPDVEDLAVGDHVALSWIPHCGNCYECRRGATHLCATYLEVLWSGTMLDGTRRLTDVNGSPVDHLSALSTWSTHSVVPAISCIKMPDVPYEISALIGCGVTTGVGSVLNKAKVTAGSSVVVFGAGGVGLSIIMAAAHAGASTIIAVDRQQDKAELAQSFGATHFLSDTDPVDAIRELTRGRGCDYAFDAVGHIAIEAQLNRCLARLGTAVLVGIPPSGATFEVDPTEFIREEKVLTGSIFGSAHTHRDFLTYAQLYLDGALPLDRLITARYELADINVACANMLEGRSGRGVIVF